MVGRILEVLDQKYAEYGLIATEELIFSDAVRDACRVNVCGKYGACHTCPPAIGTVDSLKRQILSYKSAFVFTTVHPLEDSFDFEGMMTAKEKHDALTREVHLAVGKTNPVFGAGGCSLCEVCTYPAPCVSPALIFPAVEGCGINVTDLSKSANVKYNNGANTVTYFSMVMV